jgi:hypothetical protein
MHLNSLTPIQISGTPRSFLNFEYPLLDISSRTHKHEGTT